MTDHYLFENTPLPYSYNALEPYIDAQTMMLHHDRHLQTYIDNLNTALTDHPRLQCLTLEQLICIAGRLPEAIGTPVARNAGGVYNHRFYFDGMSPCFDQFPAGALGDAIDLTYGGFDTFVDQFKTAALSVFGSGYAWLVADRCGRLKIVTTGNQDTPLTLRLYPVMTIDVWEHAYYLKHYNKRAEYIGDWFHTVNWQIADQKYTDCVNCCRL